MGIWNCQKKLTSQEFSNSKKLTSKGSVTILSLLNQLWSLPKRVFLISLNTFWQRLVSVLSEESEKQTISESLVHAVLPLFLELMKCPKIVSEQILVFLKLRNSEKNILLLSPNAKIPKLVQLFYVVLQKMF